MNMSRNHPNRGHHNWLIYNILDRFLQQHIAYYKGVIYDLGAGESPYKRFLLLYADQYVAVDWASSYHITQADIIADLNQPLPIKSAVADTVVSFSVLEHLREPQVMLNEAFRILKPGGNLILQVPWQWWIHEAPHDYFRYTPYGLNYLLTKAGFVDITVAAQSGFFTMWILKFNYMSLRYICGPLLVRGIIRIILLPIWYIGQALAPWLDRLDRNWALEATGYFVIARKA